MLALPARPAATQTSTVVGAAARYALQHSRKKPKIVDVKLSTLRGVPDGQSTAGRRRSGYAVDSGVGRHGSCLECCWLFCDFPSRLVDALALSRCIRISCCRWSGWRK